MKFRGRQRTIVLLGLLGVALLRTLTLGIRLVRVLVLKEPTTATELAVSTEVEGPARTTSLCEGTCSTLEEFYEYWSSNLQPLEASNAYVAPNVTHLEDLEWIVASMMQATSVDDCAGIPLGTLQNKYAVQVFEDSYCVVGSLSMDYPWGSAIVLQNTTQGVRYVSMDSVHPSHDLNTGRQTLALFRNIQARSMLLAGSHRYANDEVSECDGGPYKISDAAHNTDQGVQAAAKAVRDYYNSISTDYTSIQLHGMGSSSCVGVDAYLTFGSTAPPQSSTEKIVRLRDAIQSAFDNVTDSETNYTVTVPGDSPSCGLAGATNTQGRMINGVDWQEACTVPASSYNQQFIHIEQKSDLRNETMYEPWTAALEHVFPLIVMETSPDEDDEEVEEEERCTGLFCCGHDRPA